MHAGSNALDVRFPLRSAASVQPTSLAKDCQTVKHTACATLPTAAPACNTDASAQDWVAVPIASPRLPVHTSPARVGRQLHTT